MTQNKNVIKPIEYDHEMDRFYIPVNSRYEIQTKGKGSSFRIANTFTHERFLIIDERLHPMLEELAKATNAEMMQLKSATQARESEINSIKQRVEVLQADNLRLRELLKSCTDVFDNVPSRAHIVDSVDENLKRIAQWVNAGNGGAGLYQAIQQALSSTHAQSLAEHDNDVIERIATALENAEGEFKTLPEYVSLVRALKVTP